jgi:uncharacterized protein YciI
MSDAQYLYRIVPARLAMLTEGATPQEADAVTRHFAYLQELVQKRNVILAGRTLNPDEECFGIVIFRAASEAEALHIMRNDPAVREGVMVARLFPYRIALMAPHNAADDED